MDGGAWWAAVYGVAHGRTRLKQQHVDYKVEEVYGSKNRKAGQLRELFIKNRNWSWQAVRVLVKHVSVVIQNGWIVCCWVGKSCPTLGRPWTEAHQTPPSMGFPRQEYWRGLPFSSPEDLSNLGIEPTSPTLSGSLIRWAIRDTTREVVLHSYKTEKPSDRIAARWHRPTKVWCPWILYSSQKSSGSQQCRDLSKTWSAVVPQLHFECLNYHFNVSIIISIYHQLASLKLSH